MSDSLSESINSFLNFINNFPSVFSPLKLSPSGTTPQNGDFTSRASSSKIALPSVLRSRFPNFTQCQINFIFRQKSITST